MKAESIPHEVSWLATFDGTRMVMNDPEGYRRWLPTAFGAGERAMIIVVPLAVDQPRFHKAAYGYWWNVVLPIIAEEIGEANLSTAHDVIVSQFVGVKVSPKKRKGVKVTRKSTSMDSMTCAEFCDLVDRAVIWATVDLGLLIPMSDPDWKWRKHLDELERAQANADSN